MGRRYYRRRRSGSGDLGLIVLGVVGLGFLGSLIFDFGISEEQITFAVVSVLVVTIVVVLAAVFGAEWLRKKKLGEANMEAVDAMDGKQFEEFVAELCRRQGFSKVVVTPYEGDFGADVTGFWKGEKYAIQAKRYSSTVGVEGVYQILGGMKYYEADKGVLVTNRSVTKQARELAEKSEVDIVDRERLIDWIRKVNRK